MYQLQLNAVPFPTVDDPQKVIDQIRNQTDHRFGVFRLLKLKPEPGRELFSDYVLEENYSQAVEQICAILEQEKILAQPA